MFYKVRNTELFNYPLSTIDSRKFYSTTNEEKPSITLNSYIVKDGFKRK